MDIKETFENIKGKTKSLYENISDFYEENKTISLIIALIVFLLILLIFLLSFSISSANKKKKNMPVVEELVLTEDILLPGKVEQADEYILSRTSNEKWSENEAKEWFHIPGDKEIESLSIINENLVNDILKATP